MTNKKKWTLIDTLIVILVAAAAFALYKTFGKQRVIDNKRTIEAVVLIPREDASVKDAIKEGDKITVSLTEKDSGILKAIEVKDAQTMVYNSIDGVYINEPVEGMIDIFATVELEVAETDFAYTTGSTTVKVGEKLPFRGKGFALEGYVIEINEQ
ncbi:MAG: DUF4330 family protein [Clostridia bacterium]|nr:DUF4330 family protein [Clostridia bacterium]